MRNALLIAAALILCFAVLGVVFVVGMRRKSPIVLKAVRRSGRAMKPLILRSAGTASSPTAVVEHVGRTSGRHYETPVVAAPTEGGFVIALPYGPTTDWLKNLLAAGRATIRFGGARYDVEHPELVDLQQVDGRFAQKEQRLHRRFQVRDAVTVHTVSNVVR
jgi:deazaflavin-dependent oxidoreductase (nitroreductase family)